MSKAAHDTEPAMTHTLKKRALGDSGLDIAPLVFGGNVFGWTADRSTSFSLLDAFVEAGFDAIDTADAYSRWVPGHSGGESETIIGAWLKARGRRDDVKILTKVGSDMGQGRNDLSAGWIEKVVEDSLRRLQTDHIDLYQTHWPDPETPQEETLRALDRLVKAGKVRAIGAAGTTGAGFGAFTGFGAGAVAARNGWEAGAGAGFGAT
jgi:aryl-alcohol dehydrogenase-like predicted oxidoreductase